MDLIVRTMETLEESSGMDKEFGDTFSEMVENFEDDIGKEATEKILFDTVGALFGGYVSDPSELQEWFDIQKELLPKIKGLKISKHVFDDMEPGACLIGKFGDYLIEVSIEDNKLKEDIEYYDVILISDKLSPDKETVFHGGVIFTTKDIKQLVQLAKNNDIENIINLINKKYYYRKYFKKEGWVKGWVKTPKCVLENFHKQAKIPLYTSQPNVGKCICGNHKHKQN